MYRGGDEGEFGDFGVGVKSNYRMLAVWAFFVLNFNYELFSRAGYLSQAVRGGGRRGEGCRWRRVVGYRYTFGSNGESLF